MIAKTVNGVFYLNGKPKRVLTQKDVYALWRMSAKEVREKIRQAHSQGNEDLVKDLYEYYSLDLKGKRNLKDILASKRGCFK